MSDLRVGVIGCGHWGKNYLRVFHELRDVKVLECSDVLRENLIAARNRYPLLNAVHNYQDILENPDIDAVVISTPAKTHYKIAKEALDAGKHVLGEKPLGLGVGECEDLIDTAQRRQRVLMVGHTFLYHDSVRKMKQIITSDSIGSIYYLHARRNHLGLIREDVPVMWDLAPHDIAIFSYLLDKEPLWVSAIGGSYLRQDRHDVTFITLGYPDSVLGNIQVSWVDSNKIREVVVIGSKRRIVFDDTNLLESVRIFEKGISTDRDVGSFGEFKYLLRDGDIISPKIDSREPLKNQCQHFVECVKENKKPITDGMAGLKVVRVLCAAQRSIESNGVAVPV